MGGFSLKVNVLLGFGGAAFGVLSGGSSDEPPPTVSDVHRAYVTPLPRVGDITMTATNMINTAGSLIGAGVVSIRPIAGSTDATDRDHELPCFDNFTAEMILANGGFSTQATGPAE